MGAADPGETQGEGPVSGIDLQVQNHGSLCILKPLTTAGQDWLDENVGDDETMTWAGGIVCEPRYVADIVEGAVCDGLQVAA